ncbi:hypothetical protein OROMI_022008 [Orobanche minor]
MKYYSLLPLLFLYFLCAFSFSSSAGNNSNTTTVYDSFVLCLSGYQISDVEISEIVYTPNNPNFTTVLESYIRNRRFNTSTTRKPTIIVAPTAESQVSAAVLCARDLNIQLKVRSGGHDYEGTSYVSDSDFAILDMFRCLPRRTLLQNLGEKQSPRFSGRVYAPPSASAVTSAAPATATC